MSRRGWAFGGSLLATADKADRRSAPAEAVEPADQGTLSGHR